MTGSYFTIGALWFFTFLLLMFPGFLLTALMASLYFPVPRSSSWMLTLPVTVINNLFLSRLSYRMGFHFSTLLYVGSRRGGGGGRVCFSLH